MFQVLNGPTYTHENRPPFWQNEKALLANEYELEHAPLADFPLIEDFEVQLESYTKAPDFGYHIHFFSPSRGYMASFPWWDGAERALIRDDFTIPLGHPFSDVEQGWEIVIAAKDDFVYVLEGDFDDRAADYHTWFKVRQDLYLAQWQNAIQACREAFAKQP
jgi:hypothetical protein